MLVRFESVTKTNTLKDFSEMYDSRLGSNYVTYLKFPYNNQTAAVLIALLLNCKYQQILVTM